MYRSEIEAQREKAFERIDRELPDLLALRDKLYQNPEVGGTEMLAAQDLTRKLQDAGFTVTKDYYEIPHAFRAVYASQKEGATIGFFAEYDALPKIGHGCGHNLICTASLGAALALREVIDQIGGTVIVYGTPGEENLQTKTVMTPLGAFDEVDVAMMVHPNGSTYSSGKTVAVESLQIEFFGKSAHAGVSPEQGINALDAAMQCYNMINFEKQYYQNTNVYGVMTEGGKTANMIPDYTSLHFLTRAWSMRELNALRKMIEACADGAARVTGCTFRITNNESTNQPMLTNRHIAEIFDRYLMQQGEKEILREDVKGSTDMADVSWRIPSIHPWVGLDCPETALHTKEFADRTVCPQGDLFIERSSKAMAATAIEILGDKELLEKIKKEFSTQNDMLLEE